MDNNFTRAILGFIMLTGALALMSFAALWALAAYGGGSTWPAIIVALVALAAEISIYGTTLHEPIYKWIREPGERTRARDLDIEHFDSCLQTQQRHVDGAMERLRKIGSALFDGKPTDAESARRAV